MTALVATTKSIPAASPKDLEKIAELESVLKDMPQTRFVTNHLLHGGIYSRTIYIPAGTTLTGARISVPTTLIVSGKCTLYIAGKPVTFEGHNVLVGYPNRKQALFAETDVIITMSFATDAKTVDEAERESTDEYEALASHREESINNTLITGV